MSIIEVQQLKRIYTTKIGVWGGKTKEILALAGIDFEVAEGELFGILGPNGAGKTTTVKILTTLLAPSAGHAKVLGYDVAREEKNLRSHIGFIFGGERGLYWRLSGYDNLVYFANLYHLAPTLHKHRISQLLELVGLADRGDEKVQGYSRGMKQRLHVARALLHDPKILFLDEPTIGLDPVGARELRVLVKSLQEQKKTILMTTHYMYEADDLCNRIAIINHGKIIALDTPNGLKRYVHDKVVVEIVIRCFAPELVHCIKDLPNVVLVSGEISAIDGKYRLKIQTPSAPAVVGPVFNILESLGLEATDINIHAPTLEDAYVHLVGG